MNEERVQRFADRGHATDLERQLRAVARVAPRDDGAAEAEGRRFPEPELDPAHRADLAGQADLAQHERVPRDGPIHVARRGRDDDAEVRGRLGHPAAPGDVDEHVLARERHAAELLEHREE